MLNQNGNTTKKSNNSGPRKRSSSDIVSSSTEDLYHVVQVARKFNSSDLDDDVLNNTTRGNRHSTQGEIYIP